MGRFDLASALTINCHSGLCFYGHPEEYGVRTEYHAQQTSPC